MRKLLLIFALLFLSIFYVFTVNSFATEASYGDGSYSFANHAARSNGRQDCWMSASKDNEKLTLGYGGNNYDAHITEKGVFQIISNGDDTVRIKYNGRILVGDSSTFTVKLLPEATSSNLDGSKWKITSAGMQGTCWIDWVGPNSGTGTVLGISTITGEFVITRPNGSNAMWDIYRVDKNIVFQEQFHAYSFNFWNKVLGSLNFPGISVNASANSSEYNINKKLNSFDYKDYTLEGKVKPKAGTAGLLFRNDGTNMYLWSLDRTNKLAELFSINMVSGQKTKLKSKSFTVSTDLEKWYNIKITVKDSKMALYIDDVFVDFAENYSSSGLIGYWVGGTATASGSAEFDNILVKKEIQPMWYMSKVSVHDKFKDAEDKVITITDDTDINTLDIPSLSTSNFWVPFTENFDAIGGGTRVERYLFTTSIDVPDNVSNLVISGDGTSTITIDDKLAVYVNGRRVAYGLASNIQSIIIEKKYLMPGSKNDILLVLSDTGAGKIQLSKLKVTANLDSSYNKKIIEYNGFKIQYDESNPVNSKIIKYPSNIMIDGIQMNAADTPVFDESGRVKQAHFNAILTGPVYKYNGWHKCQKIFSTKPESSIDINLKRGYGNSSYAMFSDVVFEQAKFDIFDMGQNISSVQAIVNQDQSLSITSDAIFKIFGEQEDCSLSINIKDSHIYVSASSRFLLDGYLSASKKMTGYNKISDISLSGGFKYDIYRKKVTDDYDIRINTFDGAKVRFAIPKFGELSFSELTMDAATITAKNLGFTFADDCIFEGLKTSQDQKCTVEFKSLTINKEASSLKDLIKACELKVTLKQDVEVFGGLNIKAVNSKTGKQTVFTGGVKEGNFSFMFDGTLELPDDAKTQIETKFWVDTDGNFMVEAKGELENGLIIKGINLSATPGSSKVGFKFQSAVYKDNVLESPRKCTFEFENVGTTLNIPGAGNVIFTIKEFALTDNGIEDIKGGIGGSVSLFNNNMIIDAAKDGITLAYNSSAGWTVKATDVMVKFPNIGDGGMESKASFDMNSITGLGTIKCTVPSLTLFKEFVSITTLAVDVYKAPDTGKYTMTISADKLICNVKKVLPLENDTTIGAENVSLTVADLSNPSVSLNLDKLEYNRRIEFNMGLKVAAEGIAFYFNDKKVEVVKPTFTLPKDIPGIKFYKAADMKEEFTDPVVQVDYIRAIFGSSWGFEVGGAKLPGACVYNLFNMNICKITLVDLYAGYNSNKFNISVKSASVTVASGYSAELTDVKITNDDVSIGGGSITIPEINIGGIGINNLMATFGTETIGDRDYSIFGGACSITIPGLGAIGGSLKVQNYSDNFFGLIKEASFDIKDSNGKKIGTRIEFNNQDTLEKIVLSASCDKSVPNITISLNGTNIPLTHAAISTDTKEVNEVIEVNNELVDTGKIGVSTLLGIDLPLLGTADQGKGNWVIEVRCEEAVDVAFITKLSDPELVINSASFDGGNNKLTVTGQVKQYAAGEQNVTLLMKNAPKTDGDNVMPGERIVATSKNLQDMDGIKSITIGGDGKFTVVIDTTIMRSGTYSLLAELDRKVVLSKDGDLFETEGGSEDFTSGEEYKENGTIKKFDIINNTMQKVPKPDAFATCYGTAPIYMYNLDVNFKSTTKSADGYMIFADCYVGGVYKGTRKINIGNMTKARIGQFTEYLSVTNGEASYKPTMLSVYIVPYKYIDQSKGFIYDFGGKLGFETISNNITLGPESDKVDVWLQRSTSNILASVTSGMASPVEIPVEGSTKGKIIINTLDNTLDKSKILVQVKSVTKSNVDLGSKSLLGDAISVKLGDDSVDAGDYITPTAAGAYNFNLSLFANVDAAQAKAMADANTPLSVTLSVYNSSNPSNYKEITIPCKFTLPALSLKSINQDTFSSMTGGVLDVYGTQLLKGCIVKLVDSANVEQALEIIPDESGIGRIAAKIPQGIAVGEYTLKVVGPVLASGTVNTQTWSEKIKIVKSDFEWVKARDTGKIKKGATGKFYARLDSKTGFKGTAGIKVKSSPAGFIVKLNKSQVVMDEEIEAVITVPSTAEDKDYNIEFEAVSIVDSVYESAYSNVGSFVVTVTSSDIASDISSVSNKRVSVGDVFDIYGEGFTSQTTVEITTPSGMVKTLNIVSRTENKLTVSVPDGSLSGDLRTRNGSIYSPTSVPFTVVPPGIVPNFDTAPISVILAPGESTYINVNNNGKPVLTSSQTYLVTSADSQGKVKITVPASTKPGEYYAYAKVMYPNTTIEKKIVVYVVDNGNAAEDLSRQVILSGRNLYIKVKGANVSSIQIAKLEVNGTSITRTPVKVGDGWTIDVGMVNSGTMVKYQFNYVITGASFTTPIYEYKVEYQNPENTDSLYQVKLFEKDNNDVLLKVNVINPFKPDTMSITYKKGNEAEVKVPMVKNGDSWEVNLGKLVEDSRLIYSLSYGSGVDTVTSTKKELSYKTKNPVESQLEYSFTRDSATGRVKLNLTGIKVDNKDIIPTTVKVTLSDIAAVTSKTYDMVKNGNTYQADIGDINNTTKLNIKYEYIYEGEKYKTAYKSVKYNESTYPDSNNGFMAEYFDSKYFSESRLSTVDPVVDFDFTTKGPAGGLVNNSTYSMRWSGKLQARYSEEHTFYLTVPSGKATLWVDGKLIAEGKGALSGKCTLTAGKPADIIVEYAADGSGAIKLEWQSASQLREVVPQARVIAVVSSKPGSTNFAPFATQVAYDMIAIGWNTPNVTGVSYYEVYEGTTLISTLWGIKNYTRTGLVPDKDYTYQIKAYNSSKTLLATSASIVVRTERAPMDLALNKPITASSTFDTLNATKFAVDGDSSTKWTSMHGDNQWVRVDLGREYEIAKVRLNWREDYHAKYYKIQVSNDDMAWRDVYSTISGDGGIDEIRLSSVKARYVRMKATLRGINSNPYSLWDFNVYGYGYSSIKTMFYNQIIDAQNNNITPTFKIINTGTENVDLNTLKLRYYYTVDKDVPQKFTCDWTPISPHVTGTFVKMGSPKDKADYYLEIGFQTTTPILKPGENVEVKARFNREDWTFYTQTNDYSFDGVSKDYVDSNKITVYQSGNLIQGVEPSSQLANMSFDSNTSGWNCFASSAAGASVEWTRDTVNFDTAPAGFAVKCITKGTKDDSIQVYTNTSIEKGKYYNLTFKAKATSVFTIPRIALIKNVSPYTFYAVAKNAQVTTGWKTYSYTFKINTTEPNARINLLIGNAIPNGATLYLDTFSFTEVSAPAELVANTSLTYDAANWIVWSATTSGAVATGARDTVNFDTQPAGYKVNCVTKGTGTSQIQLMINGINVEDGKTYNLTFRAKASHAFNIPYFKLIKNNTPYTNYSSTVNNIAITTAWKNYHYVLTATGSDPAARLNFEMGNALPDGAQFYIDTVSFKEAIVNEITESMSNPSFNDNTSDWAIYYDAKKGASGTIARDTVNYDTQPAGLKVHCTTKGTEIGAMHVNAMGVRIEAGKTYRLTFRAKATTAFNIPRMVLIRRTVPNNVYSVVNPINSSNIAVTTAWQTYTYTFTANVTDPDSRLLFYLGNAIPDNSDLFMDTISIKEVQ
ncbi:discoidin domain-containing protein [Pseudobacteroides cellulosolvens]|uniref:Type 3a cellulose-binding domain protein n=1 Tax=Pseudobacteroides cellulosolvens ATCC 35603 = DSM 2933 TaxID=398512 RepID=A0A0L6JN70_9FIRM|nr:cellulose binding domain-containing protein [Pseudobacteroides cellulosolvens]KNY27209.1 type 3a cellulose-binding domain protein [Pseudobacteroides cellulosolvens ATCC 35603 = DSM 2933]